VSPAFIDEMAARYGTESNAFRVRVLGEFPRRDDDTVIPLELVEAAMHRDVAGAPTASAVWGLDVARFGSDASALAIRRGNVVSEVRTWRGLDLMQTCGAVKHEYDGLAPEERPAEILVDSIGLGAGVCDRLRELGLPARGVNVAESPSLGATYANLRAELWFRLKAWLEARDCRIPKDEALFAELTAPRYAFTSSGKMKVEAKDDLKRRGLPSPDRADALCLTLATDAATALYGAAPGRGWNAPLRRHIRGVV
jgi:phage terminase large subunit